MAVFPVGITDPVKGSGLCCVEGLIFSGSGCCGSTEINPGRLFHLLNALNFLRKNSPGRIFNLCRAGLKGLLIRSLLEADT